MLYKRMPIEVESPEQLGYDTIRCNLTESSFSDFTFKDLGINLDELVIAYGDHLGKPELRKLLAQEAHFKNPDQILLTGGAASALFMISTTLLERDQKILVMKPNYATNIETPRAIGAKIEFLDLKFENRYRLDLTDLKARLTPDVKVVSLTHPHNPTGMMMTLPELQEVIRLVEASNAYLVFDETYRDMSFEKLLPVAATLSPRVISVSSLSKTYGIPGIRLGWLMTQDAKLFETLLAAKEQMVICNSIVDEEIAYQFFLKKAQFLGPIQKSIQSKFQILKSWMSEQDIIEWVEPQGGCVSFPRFTQPVSGKPINTDRFYQILNQEYKTHVGPGHWFEMPRTSMRIGYGWPTEERLREGLSNIEKAFRQSL